MNLQPENLRAAPASTQRAEDDARPRPVTAQAKWLRDFFPGYFALVMGTGIVAVAARELGYALVAWPLFVIALLAYAMLGIIVLARLVRFPRAVLADFASHERGPNFLTIVAATGVLGSQFDAFDTLAALLPMLFWFSLGLWCVLIYGFLSLITVSRNKPDLEHGLNGSWLLLVVATESLAVLSGALALRSGAPPSLAFIALAFFLLGAVLYVLLTALILLRWIFRPMPLGQLDASWWINMGAVAIATLAGTQLMSLPGATGNLEQIASFVGPFTTLLWATSTFWIPLLVILFIYKGVRQGRSGYDPRDWSAVFPLGMYVVATQNLATVGGLPFLEWIPRTLFWFALLAWTLTFVSMWVHLSRLRVPPARSQPTSH